MPGEQRRPWLHIDQARRVNRMMVTRDQGHAGIETDIRRPCDDVEIARAEILAQIRDDDEVIVLNREVTDALVAVDRSKMRIYVA